MKEHHKGENTNEGSIQSNNIDQLISTVLRRKM
jgi:hypothetical protein